MFELVKLIMEVIIDDQKITSTLPLLQVILQSTFGNLSKETVRSLLRANLSFGKCNVFSCAHNEENLSVKGVRTYI